MAKIVKGRDFEKKTGGNASPAIPPIRRKVTAEEGDEGSVISHEVLTAREQAEKILSEAEAEAKRICEEAAGVLANVDSEREHARREGTLAGESKGLAQVTEKLVRFEEMKASFYAQAEREVVNLVMAIAEKVVGKLVDENPQAICAIVHQALERSLGDRITVRLNPEDYRSVMAGDTEFRDIVDRTKRLMFREDESILKGGCVVETEIGTIDAQLETQMEAVRKALMP